MIVLTDCLTYKADEGCLKIANSLIKRMKEHIPGTVVLSYENQTELSDCHMELNKLFLNPRLFRFLRKKKQPVLYIPFSSNTRASVIRTWVLSKCCTKVYALYALRHPMDGLSKWLLQRSGAEILTLSRESHRFFSSNLTNRVHRFRTGIDVEKFTPAEESRKKQIR